jgi:arylsulfatase
MGDDIGWFNLSCYNHSVMGYRTPNLDRIGKEGAMFDGDQVVEKMMPKS